MIIQRFKCSFIVHSLFSRGRHDQTLKPSGEASSSVHRWVRCFCFAAFLGRWQSRRCFGKTQQAANCATRLVRRWSNHVKPESPGTSKHLKTHIFSWPIKIWNYWAEESLTGSRCFELTDGVMESKMSKPKVVKIWTCGILWESALQWPLQRYS